MTGWMEMQEMEKANTRLYYGKWYPNKTSKQAAMKVNKLSFNSKNSM